MPLNNEPLISLLLILDIWHIMQAKLTEQDIQLIIDSYNNGKRQSDIAEQFNYSQTGISSILKRKKIQTRVGKYTDINNIFFKEINCEESAYFLGLLYADGCVQIKNSAYTVSLKLKSDDQYIIEKFRDIMSPSSPIKISYAKYSYFRINQKKICEQLISHGCVPNKSLILNFPTTVPAHLMRHFIRGYSDGDGTIYNNNVSASGKQYINTIWKIVSTGKFCKEVAFILNKELNINCSQSLSNDNGITTTLSVGGNKQVKKVLDWMYEDCAIYLPRKYNKYQEFIKRVSLALLQKKLRKINGAYSFSPDIAAY